MPIKVMLVDDHPLFLEGLQNLLQAHGIQVIGTAKNGNEALIKAKVLKPDVILMDIAMPVCSGLEAISPIKNELPQVKIVMLTSFDNDDNLFEAIKRGASGYLLKTLKAKELVSLLQDLERGDAPLSPGLAVRLLKELAHQKVETLTDIDKSKKKETAKPTTQQMEILKLLARGMTYKEIGTAMNLSERTIKYHMARILEVLQLENRAQAIAYFAREKAHDGE